MAAWHPPRDKVKRREGINTEHKGRAPLTVTCPDERGGERDDTGFCVVRRRRLSTDSLNTTGLLQFQQSR